MDLHTVTEVVSPAVPGDWRAGDAWLAGGTALFSEPRPSVTRLLDLTTAGWEPLTAAADGLEIAATCTVATLYAFEGSPAWSAWHALARRCCESFLASFKIWNVATVGGNLCAALPAGPMITLTAALDGSCLLLGPSSRRVVPVTALVTGDGTTCLRPGELLRSIHLPAAALDGSAALRQGSLHPLGRSAVLLAGRLGAAGFALTVTASTRRPFVFRFPALPSAGGLAAALDFGLGDADWVEDVHGSPAWRRHLTYRYAEEIRRELAGA
ncbi:FAD-binding molybdopterin dehydrogenase [Virgisporangium aliadipatigenens]|uniref:FAD-binding molybdopterin dehydrogenase n=1 Tax=Virgisporangium aliadipatigenens TaxID=741659 RepID=A0A8J4DP44_9ACTN|nr:FAD binding domain-containing protein [Virgisporangium aliadipatigenens]GIJ45565.1 FAD-binding molybdopterin dehydrogenase [Virgisporangium aliadipatigenens]